MDKKFITIREKSAVDDLEPDAYDTGEATRKQVYTYIFTDFIRGSMVVGFLFFDTLIIAELWSTFLNNALLYVSGLNLIFLYYVIGMIFLEFIIVNYERKLYSRVRNRLRDITRVD